MSNELTASAAPLTIARQLARIYGHAYAPPLTYPLGVSLCGRLRVAEVDGTLDEVAVDVARLVEDRLDAAAAYEPRFGGAGLATACWADELHAATGDVRYAEHLLRVADRFRDGSETGLLDPDIRVEDFFFAATLLGRAFALSGDPIYHDILVDYLSRADTQQADGLFWHCHASPYYWGRGNAFAALGFAEALTYVGPSDPELLEPHVRHCRALAAHQDASGLWHQLVDDPSTYLEHSATSMVGCAIARGVRLGWLESSEFAPVVERAWRGLSARTTENGELEHVCIGTGPLDSRRAYAERAYTDTTDERGGAMALWFAVEMARLGRET